MYKQIDSNKRKTFFYVLFFLIFVIALGWIFSAVFNLTWILYLAVFIALFQAFASYYWSSQITLAISGAKKVPRREPYLSLHRLVENLAITAGLPKPEIYIIDSLAMNAFATGRDPNHAVIAVTAGLLEKLSKTELEGVIAHEMSHIKNYDIRLMTAIVVLVGVVALASNWFLRFSFFGGRGNRDDNQSNAILMILGIFLAILSPIIAQMIQLAVSRKREFLADADGALLTRYPDGLASALEKINDDQNSLETANTATAHLYIENPFKGEEKASWFAKLFMTHPPISERIKALHSMIGKK